MRVNCLNFDLNNYDGDKEAMWKNITAAMRVLIDENYKFTFHYEDCGIYCLEYELADTGYGGPVNMWLSPTEAESVWTERSSCP